jgi:hypothetical protein
MVSRTGSKKVCGVCCANVYQCSLAFPSDFVFCKFAAVRILTNLYSAVDWGCAFLYFLISLILFHTFLDNSTSWTVLFRIAE